MRLILNFLTNHLIGLFFIAIMGASLASLVIFLSNEDNLYDESIKNAPSIASLEISDFSLSRITNGKTDLVIHGKSVIKLPDSEIFEKINASRIIGQNNSVEKISSEIAIKNHEIITFPNGITYNKDGVHFDSNSGALDMKQNIFKGNGEFSLNTQDSKISGQDLLYNIKERAIKGSNIIANVQ